MKLGVVNVEFIHVDDNLIGGAHIVEEVVEDYGSKIYRICVIDVGLVKSVD